MIKQETLDNIKSWFENYLKNYQSSDPYYQQNIDLKKDHTFRVCQEILNLAQSLSLGKKDLRLAETIALLHDIGRFEQYNRYATFSDTESEDHAQLGIKIIRQNHVLKKVDKPTSELILRTIAYHNRAVLPKKETERCLFFAKLLRDADKLDILYVVTNYYHRENKSQNKSLELDLPNIPKISHEVYNDIMSGRSVRTSHINTLNDFKILQMAWIYDINFPRTFQLIRQRSYLEKIKDVLPQSDKTQRIYSTLKSYLDKKCNNFELLV